MITQLYCPENARKAQVYAQGTLNGIDYLEVLDDDAPGGSPPQRTVLVHCFLPIPGLTASNVRIEGGVRVSPVGVDWAYPANLVPAGLLTTAEQAFLASHLSAPERVLVVRTNQRGDFSTYTLRLLLSPTQPDLPPAGFDLLLGCADFSFKVDCPREFDCQTVQVCPEPTWPAPQIDYLAKDYASFRRLMLDRLAVIMPDWQERNPADVGIALVEVLAYVADYLSYYQDAVATEAYLGTARRRVSVRRHARLVDYRMHNGANARAWVCFEVEPLSSADGATLPAGTPLLTRETGAGTSLAPDQVAEALSRGGLAFETLHAVSLSATRNAIPFHTWGDPRCCLPAGATQATLRAGAADLGLHEGDVLVFEEVLGPASGLEVDANPANRHVVRLDSPSVERVDPLTSQVVLDIRWHAEDALPFPLLLWEFPDPSAPNVIRGAVVARGNVALVDHGLTIDREPLWPETVPDSQPYRPRLQRTGLTHAMPYDHEQARAQPAATATRLDQRGVLPVVSLRGDNELWLPQQDLLNSDRFAAEFVVEMEEDATATLRFGDGILGREPAPGARFTATYRMGNGRAGNVGSDALSRVATLVQGIRRVRNPLAAMGGTDPESMEQVRQYAPQAFRTQERAVTGADYAAAAQRHPEVQRAAATRRWTGSWYTMFVTVDRAGGRPVDPAFEEAIGAFLERFRLAGYDLEIDGPLYVPLDIVLSVCVAPGYFRANVKQALLDAFSSRDLPDGRRGFFHPDQFTFAQPVYLSQVVATAMQVPGVSWVDTDASGGKPNRFQRWGKTAHGELEAGRIIMDRLEIARLDNDPNLPENGRLDFIMQGGL